MDYFGMEIRQPFRDRSKGHGQKTVYSMDLSRFFMEEFARQGFRGADLAMLNICRMFLHCVTLADICTVDGKAITLSAWQGRREWSCGAEFEWPRVQESLSPRYWEFWNKALRSCFLAREELQRAILERLGKWQKFPPCWQ
jgi:hypothetical protein